MSYNHTTEGFEELDGFLRALDFLGIAYTNESLQYREIHFTAVPAGKRKPRKLVAKEFLYYEDEDWSDGTDLVTFVVYEEGNPPDMGAEVEKALEALQRRIEEYWSDYDQS